MKPRRDLANSAVGSGPLEAPLLEIPRAGRKRLLPSPLPLLKVARLSRRLPAARAPARRLPAERRCAPGGCASSAGRRALAPSQPRARLFASARAIRAADAEPSHGGDPKEARGKESIRASQWPAYGATDANSQAGEGGARRGENAGSTRGSVCILPASSSPALYL